MRSRDHIYFAELLPITKSIKESKNGVKPNFIPLIFSEHIYFEVNILMSQ